MKNQLSLFIFILALLPVKSQTPQLAWAKGIGSTSNDFGYDIAVDRYGNNYTTGAFKGTVDFDPGSGTTNLSAAGLEDIYVTKFSSSGNFIWARQIGGYNSDNGYSIALDGSGNVYVAGNFGGTVDFDPGAGTTNLSSAGGWDMCILKLDVNGNFKWAKTIGNTFNQGGGKLTTDVYGNVLITGGFNGSMDFNPGTGIYTLNAADYDIFVAKLDSAGDFMWARQMGGASADNAINITTDAAGNIYTTGIFHGNADFNPGAGTYSLSCTSESDVFISKLDASGDFVWAKSLPGESFDAGHSIKTDENGNIYIGGQYSSKADFDPDPSSTFYMTSHGEFDLFLLKLDPYGSFIWAKSIGGPSMDLGRDIALDNSGNIYFIGTFQGTVDFDPDPAATFDLSSGSWNAVYLLKMDNSGNFAWAEKLGSEVIKVQHYGQSVAIDQADNIYTTGAFQATVDFDPGSGTCNLQASDGADIFICKLYKNNNWNSISASQDIALYPNPTKGELTIQVSSPVPGNRIQVYNSLGTLIMEKTGLNEWNSIDLSTEINGIYWVRVMNDTAVLSTQTIMKQ